MNSTTATSPKKWKGDSKLIQCFQYLLPISFTIAMTGIIVWILSLIRLSRKLHDVPSASIGISLVAIPVFLILLVVFWYVFLGIMLNREESREEKETDRPKNPQEEMEN
jgi:membrane protein implicated in regulation of membrane protease activity